MTANVKERGVCVVTAICESFQTTGCWLCVRMRSTPDLLNDLYARPVFGHCSHAVTGWITAGVDKERAHMQVELMTSTCGWWFCYDDGKLKMRRGSHHRLVLSTEILEVSSMVSC